MSGESSLQKPALFSDGGDIPCTVKNPNNDKFAIAELIVNGIGMMKRHAQTNAKLLTAWSH